jgi:hypothetical protein
MNTGANKMFSSGTNGRTGLRLVVALIVQTFAMSTHAGESERGGCGFWVQETLTHVVRYQQNPLRATRNLSLVSAACSDAVLAARNSVDDAEFVSPAAHLASANVLAYLYPQDSVGKLRAKGRYLARTSGNGEIDPSAQAIAGEVVRFAMRRAMRDGGDAVWNRRLRPAPAPDIWRAAAPLNMSTPLEPLAANWNTWVLQRPDEIETPPPETYGTDAYWSAAREVYDVSQSLTADQKRIADDWHLDAGSVTPAGVWNLKVLEMIERHQLDDNESATLLAALNVAMADAQIASWHVKYTYWTVRPVNVIRERIDPDWLPYLFTPVFPSYVSGHATVSGAAAAVIACTLPAEADTARAMAAEAAMSRLYGGIHFRGDNDEGLKLGAAIGRKVCDRLAANDGEVRWLGDEVTKRASLIDD